VNKQVKRSYTTEFKESAVNLVISSDKPTANIAKELGINPTTLYSWVNKARDTDNQESGTSNAQMFDELKRLKKELAEVIKHFDIFKNILFSFFSGQIAFMIDQACFQCMEKAFSYCVIPAISFSTHALNNAMFR